MSTRLRDFLYCLDLIQDIRIITIYCSFTEMFKKFTINLLSIYLISIYNLSIYLSSIYLSTYISSIYLPIQSSTYRAFLTLIYFILYIILFSMPLLWMIQPCFTFLHWTSVRFLTITRLLLEKSCIRPYSKLSIYLQSSYYVYCYNFIIHRISVADPDLFDPFHFDQPDPDPGSKKSAKIMENFNENHKNFIHFFKKLLNLCLLT